MGPALPKRTRFPTEQATRDDDASPASRGGHDSDTESSNGDQQAEVNSSFRAPRRPAMLRKASMSMVSLSTRPVMPRKASMPHRLFVDVAGDAPDDLPDLGKAGKRRNTDHDLASSPAADDSAPTPESSKESWPKGRAPHLQFEPEL
jgi:hypothetical protein